MMPVADNDFTPLITTFFSQMFSELYRLADYNMGKLPNNVIMLLDEFANIGKLPNFEQRLSTCRALGIEVTIILQDMSQLERIYGKDISREIINNCDTRMLLKAAELQSAKYFSDLAGKTTIQVTNKSHSNSSKSSSKSESSNYVARSLITADEVTRLNKDEMLLFVVGKHPMKIKKAWYFKRKEFKKLIKDEVSRDEYPMTPRGDYEVYYPPTWQELQEQKDQAQEVIDYDDVVTFSDTDIEEFKGIGHEAYEYEQEIAATNLDDESFDDDELDFKETENEPEPKENEDTAEIDESESSEDKPKEPDDEDDLSWDDFKF